MDLPRVSIVTPSLNQGRFLEQALQSVAQQDYPHLEHWVIDGGSTDETLSILQRWRGKIHWISEPDRGQSDALNKGFRRATGEIVAWLNADDYLLPGAVWRVVRAFQEHPGAVLVYGDGWITDETGTWRAPYGVEGCFDLWKLIHLYDFIAQPSAFMRREALLAAGGVDERYHYVMDWELWIRLARQGEVVFVPEPLSCTRVYRAAKTQRGGWRRWQEIWQMTRQYGQYPWFPPVVFIHVPSRYLVAHRGRHGERTRRLLALGRWLLRPLNMGKHSGVYPDGALAPRAHLTLPWVEGARALVWVVESLGARRMEVRAHLGGLWRCHLNPEDPIPREVAIAFPDLRGRSPAREGLIHWEIRAHPAPWQGQENGTRRRVGLRLRGLYYVDARGRRLPTPGHPNWQGVSACVETQRA